MKRLLTVAVLLAIFAVAFAAVAMAKSDYVSKLPADKQSQGCNACHTNIPELNDAGKAFAANGHVWPQAKSAPKAPAPASSSSQGGKTASNEPKATSTATEPKATSTATVNVKVDVLGKASTVKALKSGGKVLLPVRDVANIFGAKVVGWDNKAKKATVLYNGQELTYPATVVRGVGYTDAAKLAAALGATFNAQTLTLAVSASNAQPQTPKVDTSQVISQQWAKSGHNVKNWGELTQDSPVNRDNCIACHDGQGFANNKTKRADLPEAVRNTPNSIGCDSCHGTRGQEIMKSGATPVLANGYKATESGAGALCITCHNGRKLPDPEKKPAPHRGPQFDILKGIGGARVAGVNYPSSPHGANPDTCVSCHMGPNGGVPNHTFRILDTPAYAEATCGKCHSGLTTINRGALADYDGDKVVEGIQDEVKGLLAVLEEAIKAKEAELGVKGGENHGSLEWKDASGKVVDNVPTELYNAVFNLELVENDGSHGVHNPAYVVTLLQQSYRQLTGRDVPGAVIR